MIKKIIFYATLILGFNLTQAMFSSRLGQLRQLGQSGWQQALKQQAAMRHALKRGYKTTPAFRVQKPPTSPITPSTLVSRASYQKFLPVLPITTVPYFTSQKFAAQPGIRAYSTPAAPQQQPQESWYQNLYNRLFGPTTSQEPTQEYLKNWYPNIFLKIFSGEQSNSAQAITLRALVNQFLKDNPDISEEDKNKVINAFNPRIEDLEKRGKSISYSESKAYTAYLEEIVREWEEGYKDAGDDKSWAYLMGNIYQAPFHMWLNNRIEIDSKLGKHKNLNPKTHEGAENLITKHIISSTEPPSELSEEERTDFLTYFLAKPLRIRAADSKEEQYKAREKHRFDFSESIKGLGPAELISKVYEQMKSPQKRFHLYTPSEDSQTQWTFEQLIEDAAAKKLQKMSPEEIETIKKKGTEFQESEGRKAEEVKRTRKMAEDHFRSLGFDEKQIENVLGLHGK